jgi:hypothetical protein
MSENPLQAPLTETIEFICISPMCKDKNHKLSRKAVQFDLTNFDTSSVLVYPHETGLTCKYCDTYYQIGIMAIQTQIQWGISPRPHPSSVSLEPEDKLKKLQLIT